MLGDWRLGRWIHCDALNRRQGDELESGHIVQVAANVRRQARKVTWLRLLSYEIQFRLIRGTLVNVDTPLVVSTNRKIYGHRDTDQGGDDGEAAPLLHHGVGCVLVAAARSLRPVGLSSGH